MAEQHAAVPDPAAGGALSLSGLTVRRPVGPAPSHMNIVRLDWPSLLAYDFDMQMTDSYAAAVTVTIPILALAAGGEARAIRERVRKPHEEWERQYREYLEQHPLDLGGSVEDLLGHVLEVPRLPRLFRIERALALVGAVVWLIVFTLLTVVELLTLQWLADGDPAGHAGLAGLALWSVAVGFASLIVAPMAYLVMPVFLSYDLVPAGLRLNVTAQLAEGKGDVKGLAGQLAAETGGALERISERLAAEEAERKGRVRKKDKTTRFVSPRTFTRLMREELTPQRSAVTAAAVADASAGPRPVPELAAAPDAGTGTEPDAAPPTAPSTTP